MINWNSAASVPLDGEVVLILWSNGHVCDAWHDFDYGWMLMGVPKDEIFEERVKVRRWVRYGDLNLTTTIEGWENDNTSDGK